LVAFREAGAKVAGTDYSPKLVALANEHGIEMQAGGLDVVTGTWDVIILSHVLEHFSDPLGVLRKLSTRLNKLGVLYVEVPNILHFNIGQLQSAHTYYFSPATLLQHCSNAGLTNLSHSAPRRNHQYAVFQRRQNPAVSVGPSRRAYLEVLAAVAAEGGREIVRIGLRATRLYGIFQRARLR
jgi:2-polyprenyl-3-methyl-5-hydroxy-6-metoxy-1,4-benzoquinol methylase